MPPHSVTASVSHSVTSSTTPPSRRFQIPTRLHALPQTARFAYRRHWWMSGKRLPTGQPMQTISWGSEDDCKRVFQRTHRRREAVPLPARPHLAGNVDARHSTQPVGGHQRPRRRVACMGAAHRAHDAYAQGDKVSHNGKHWTSKVDNNVWEPGVYGWTEVA